MEPTITSGKINIFAITDLQERKAPKKQNEFGIKLHVKEQEQKEEQDVPTNIKILYKDKRKSSVLDRELVLKRLKMTVPIAVEKTLISKAPVPETRDDEDRELKEEMKRLQQSFAKENIEEKEAEEEPMQIEKQVEKQKEFKEDEYEEQELLQIEEEKIKKPRKKKVAAVFKEEEPVDLTVARIGESMVIERLPKKQKLRMAVSAYYMNNRKLFITQLAKMFKPYRDKIVERAGEISCNTARTESIDFELLSHQLVVRDYLNLYTPYRGLLLYHGLGSGKTCTSIGIAEGMKSGKSIVLMTPASLKMNFFSELKKCGDALYKKNQFWEFISIKGEPQNVGILIKALGLTREYITEHGGAWMVDISKASNYAQLTDADQKAVDDQLNMMIRNKYFDINYNGLNTRKMDELTAGGKKNPFDNKVVIVDEAHNLVSRIANANTKKNSIPFQLYKLLLDATNAKIVFLTGTPIINTPREIGILFNMLRGYIKTWTFQLQPNTTKKINRDTIIEYFYRAKFATYDFVDYSGDKLIVTRNPFGFVNTYAKSEKRGGSKNKKATKKNVKKNARTTKKKRTIDEINKIEEETEPELEEYTEREKEYNKLNVDLYEGGGAFEDYAGVRLDEMGNISDAEFQKQIIRILEEQDISVIGKPKIVKELALPDQEKVFYEMFINNQKGELVNTDLLKRRILGLTSYFRSAQEQLLPSFVEDEEGSNYHIVNVDMSPHQFDIYKDIRKDEREEEARKRKKKAKKQDEDEDIFSSTYRIYSRSACNFTFPREHPRPRLRVSEEENIGIEAFDHVTKEVAKEADDYFEEGAEAEAETEEKEVGDYPQRVKEAYEFLEYNPARKRDVEYLTKRELPKYSPKFSKMLENLSNEKHRGLHLVYSQFRTLEGIGIFKLVLEANGFVEFKISKKGGEWQIDNHDVDPEKPRFVLYTGTETAEQKEIVRNIYNSDWKYVPPSIVSVLKETHANNFLGEVIKVIMITASGSEGINLRNTRFVHIMEPYWNMVRIDQTVGRARRICSHEDLPKNMRTVQVFVYISRVTEEQLSKNIEMRTNDISKLKYQVVKKNGEVKIDNLPFSTDQYLFEIAQIKDSINRQILTAVKESAIDCTLYNTNPKEPLVCYGFGKVTSNNFGSHPILEIDRSQKPEVVSAKKQLVKITINGVDYAMDKLTKMVYEFESYKKAKAGTGELISVGVFDERTKKIIFDK